MTTPILLVPGLLCTSEVFGPQLPRLWLHAPVMIASTLDGTTISRMAEAILATAPPEFALGGISMGGYVCLEIIRQASERVVKLALLNTSARPDTPDQSAQRRALVETARTDDFETMLAKVLQGIVHPDRRHDLSLLAANVRMGLAVGFEGFVHQTEAIIGRSDSRPHLSEIAVPTVVIAGDRDPLMPPDHARELVDGIAGANLVVVENCGHASTLERPDAVGEALVKWLTC